LDIDLLVGIVSVLFCWVAAVGWFVLGGGGGGTQRFVKWFCFLHQVVSFLLA